MSETPESTDWLERMFAQMNTPEAKLKSEQENHFKREVLYVGLKDLNHGLDSPLIGHFSPGDFPVVIDRCEALNVGVIGIEMVTSDVEQPVKMQLLKIEISPEPARLGPTVSPAVHG
jgi:hypothetical protein